MPRGVHINVQESEKVKAGDPLMDGPRNPHDILAVLGEKELQKYRKVETTTLEFEVPEEGLRDQLIELK